MTPPAPPSRILLAIDALRRFDRGAAAALLADELRHGPATGERWRSAGKLALTIGEIDIAVECARRYSRTTPMTLPRLLHYWSELASSGRLDEALAEAMRLPPATRDDPNVLHFLGTTAGERGDFVAAEEHYRRALTRAPTLFQTWFALAMIKTFTPDDPDLAAMERLRSQAARAEPAIQARFLYGLAKAWSDCGEYDRSFALYDEGAALCRQEQPFNAAALSGFADRLIAQMTPESLARLTPSSERTSRALFVNGLPRSGTTLVEQILASHSMVSDGDELNLLRAALIPTGDYSFAGALAYQQRGAARPDPWGDLARDYHRMIAMRFGTKGRIVDKTLSQSHYMGLLLHALPGAKVVWMRRNPADTALSCYRSFFTAPIGWSWSLETIAQFFRIEDRLYRHWSALFPDRILTVHYEDLVRDPKRRIAGILAHFGLPDEPQVRDFHKTRRSVRTASVQQVRAPISTNRVGAAEAYGRHLDAFRRVYEA